LVFHLQIQCIDFDSFITKTMIYNSNSNSKNYKKYNKNQFYLIKY